MKCVLRLTSICSIFSDHWMLLCLLHLDFKGLPVGKYLPNNPTAVNTHQAEIKS